jgi:hypothetical protein
LDKPLILCEGKTDIIYLKCALKQLISDYPEFVERSEEGFRFKVGFLNFSRNIKDVLSISEGTPGLASVMEKYQWHMRPFKGEGRKHPVVILVDNDSGSKEIKKKIKNEDTSKPFSRFVENLYVILIPSSSSGEDVAIEDLFEKKILDTKIDRKIFNRKPKLDPKTEYGKIVFAEKVIKINQEKINFDGFRGIFDRLKEVIGDYSSKIAEPSA